MKKILIGLVVIVALLAFAIYLYPQSRPSPNVVQMQRPTSTPGVSSPTSTHIFISTIGLLENKSTFPIRNATTGDVISTKSTGETAQNPTSFIYVNQKKAGEIVGYSSMASFSPNNQYFAVLQTMNEGCAGGCLGFNILVINLANGTARNLQPQPAPHDEFVESYEWDGDNAINVTSYPVSDSYRVSPKQVWRFDLITGSSTLVASTP